MGIHRIAHDMALGAVVIPSTTDAETIKDIEYYNAQIEITTAGAETRVLAEPKVPGCRLTLVGVDITTSCTITNAGDYAWNGTNDQIVLDADGEFAVVESMNVDGTLKWALTASRATLSSSS